MAIPVEDFVSAALRHTRDAEHLARGPHPSPDQAWHLAGFAHECARKALLTRGWVPKMLGHDFLDATESVVDIAIALDPRAGRFPVRDWNKRYPSVRAWRAEHRYERTGTAAAETARDVDQLVADAREATDACVYALFLEGSLAVESLL